MEEKACTRQQQALSFSAISANLFYRQLVFPFPRHCSLPQAYVACTVDVDGWDRVSEARELALQLGSTAILG